MLKLFYRFSILGLCLLLLTNPIHAQMADAQAHIRIVEIEEEIGDVQVKYGNEDEWKPAEQGMQLTEKCELKTGTDSTAVLLLDENGASGRVDVSPNTHLRITELQEEEDAKRTMLDLALGQVLVQAEKLKGKSSFQVRTPTATTSVRGTVYQIRVEE